MITTTHTCAVNVEVVIWF